MYCAFPLLLAMLAAKNVLTTLFPLATVRQRTTLYMKNYRLHSSERTNSTRLLICRQSLVTLSEHSPIFNADRPNWGTFLNTTSTNTTYHTGIYGYEHGYFTDCWKVETFTTTRIQPSFCRPNIPFFFLQYAHSTPDAAPNEAQLALRF